MKSKKDSIIITEDCIAMDQNLEVFAGYEKGYPIWCSDVDRAKPINKTTHIEALKRWFPFKKIEFINL